MLKHILGKLLGKTKVADTKPAMPMSELESMMRTAVKGRIDVDDKNWAVWWYEWPGSTQMALRVMRDGECKTYFVASFTEAYRKAVELFGGNLGRQATQER